MKELAAIGDEGVDHYEKMYAAAAKRGISRRMKSPANKEAGITLNP